jgi:hypothetical protein
LWEPSSSGCWKKDHSTSNARCCKDNQRRMHADYTINTVVKHRWHQLRLTARDDVAVRLILVLQFVGEAVHLKKRERRAAR